MAGHQLQMLIFKNILKLKETSFLHVAGTRI